MEVKQEEKQERVETEEVHKCLLYFKIFLFRTRIPEIVLSHYSLIIRLGKFGFRLIPEIYASSWLERFVRTASQCLFWGNELIRAFEGLMPKLWDKRSRTETNFKGHTRVNRFSCSYNFKFCFLFDFLLCKHIARSRKSIFHKSLTLVNTNTNEGRLKLCCFSSCVPSLFFSYKTGWTNTNARDTLLKITWML